MTTLEKIRAKQAELQNKNAKKGNPIKDKWLFKPKAGKNQIRIIPFHDEELPFISAYMEQFDVVRNDFMCSPLTYGNPDPIDSFFREAANGKKGDEYKAIIQYAPKTRTFVPIIVRGTKGTDEKDTIKFWGVSDGGEKSMLNKIMALYENPFAEDDDDASVEVHDLQSGYDIVFTYVPMDKATKTMASYSALALAPKPTPATTDKALMNEILTGLPTKEQFLVEPTYEELMTKLETYLKPKPQSNTSITSNEDVRTTAGAGGVKNTQSNVITDVTDDMFDGLGF